MRQRKSAHLLRAVSEGMFTDAQNAILQGIRSLNDWLVRKYADMDEAVSRQAGIVVENLKLDGDQMSAAAIEKEREELQRILQLVTVLMDGLTETVSLDVQKLGKGELQPFAAALPEESR